MKQFRILFIISCLSGCFNSDLKTYQQQGIVVIDLTKKNPDKEFFVDDADVEYIPLETTTEVLADGDFIIKYVSNRRIVATNNTRGDIFIFGRDGKIISHLNF